MIELQISRTRDGRALLPKNHTTNQQAVIACASASHCDGKKSAPIGHRIGKVRKLKVQMYCYAKVDWLA